MCVSLAESFVIPRVPLSVCAVQRTGCTVHFCRVVSSEVIAICALQTADFANKAAEDVKGVPD